MKVTLIAPRWLHVYGSYRALSRQINFHPPLGLCYLASSLEHAGYNVDVIDCESEDLDTEGVIERIKNGNSGVVGISATSPLIAEAAKLAVAIKVTKEIADIPVVLGGPHITLVGPKVLDTYPQFDYGVMGEGEKVFTQFVEILERGGANINKVPGIVYRVNGNVRLTSPNSEALNLDSLPFPDRSKLKMEKFRWPVPGRGTEMVASILASRGCPLKCIFCSQDRIYPRKVRFRSIENIMVELEQIKDKTSAKHIVFVDDTLTLNRKWAMELFKRMEECKFGFTFECESVANMVDEELAEVMVRAGLVRINFGIESGDPKILEVLGKGVKIHEIERAFKIMKSLGVETRGSIMIGNPYESLWSVIRTFRFVIGLRELDQLYINIAAPYPGTVLREMAIRGEGGLRLIDKRYEAIKRYGATVMEVNDLSAKDLIRLQRWGTLMFYLTPRRIIHNIKRAGTRSAIQGAIAFLKTLYS